MERVIKLWNKVSYEAVIFAVFMVQFLTTRAYDVIGWAAAWNAMDYSMGRGSRLLIGSIYRLFYGEYLDQLVAYKYTCIGLVLAIAVMSLVFGRMIRMSLAAAPSCRNLIFGMVMLYFAAPFSMSYLWNSSNMGRLDQYLFLVAMLSMLVALCVKNIYVKMLLFTVLGILGMAIHQGFAFIYYPLVVSLMCADAFGEYRVNRKNLALCIISGLIEIAVFFYFQFGSKLNFADSTETSLFLSQRTNLPFAELAIDLEYFKDLEYVRGTILKGFFAEEAPLLHLFVALFLMLPVLILYVLIWRDVFCYYRQEKKRIFCGPHLYVLLTNLCYIPIFAMQTDWGRWIAPLLAGQLFVIFFYLAKGDIAMRYACIRMMDRMRKTPWLFVAVIAWMSMFDSFGARQFQNQADALLYTLRHGFHQ